MKQTELRVPATMSDAFCSASKLFELRFPRAAVIGSCTREEEASDRLRWNPRQSPPAKTAALSDPVNAINRKLELDVTFKLPYHQAELPNY
jgi:hypothetical protein